MRMIFVNLPVKDLAASKAFFSALGFEFNAEFSDDKAACMVVDQQHLRDAARRGAVPGLRQRRPGRRHHGDRGDDRPVRATAAQQVDDLAGEGDRRGRQAVAGRSIDDGPMYGGSFQDLDGHVWELMHMDVA